MSQRLLSAEQVTALSAKNRAARKPTMVTLRTYTPGAGFVPTPYRAGFDALFDGSEQEFPPINLDKPKKAPVKRAGKGATVAQASRGSAGKPAPTEHEEQVLLMALWAHYALHHGIPERLLMAIPNAGAGASRGQAGKMKAEGVRAGAPDLFLAVPKWQTKLATMYSGLWLELKRVSWIEPGSGAKALHWRNQCAFHQLLQSQGYRVRVCAGAESAMDAIEDYLK